MGGSDTSPDKYSTFGAACENLSEADAITANLKTLDGVESVRLGIVREFVLVDDWLVSTIERHPPENRLRTKQTAQGRVRDRALLKRKFVLAASELSGWFEEHHRNTE